MSVENQIINPNRNLLIQNLSEMISIPSVNPFGIFDINKPAEEDMANFFENCLLN